MRTWVGWAAAFVMGCGTTSDVPDAGDAAAKDAKPVDAKPDQGNPFGDGGVAGVPAGTLLVVASLNGTDPAKVCRLTLPAGTVQELWPLAPVFADFDGGTLIGTAIAKRPDKNLDVFAHVGGATPTTYVFDVDSATGASAGPTRTIANIVLDAEYASDGTLWATVQGVNTPPPVLATVDAQGVATTKVADNSSGYLTNLAFVGSALYVTEIDPDEIATTTFFTVQGSSLVNPQPFITRATFEQLGGVLIVFDGFDVFSYDPVTLSSSYPNTIHSSYSFGDATSDN